MVQRDYDSTRVKCGNTLLAKDNHLPVPSHHSSTLVMFGFTSCAKPEVTDHGQPRLVEVKVRPATVTLRCGRLYWQLGGIWQSSTGQGQHIPPANPPMQHLYPDSLCGGNKPYYGRDHGQLGLVKADVWTSTVTQSYSSLPQQHL